MTKTMKITLNEDFLVPTDDGNIIFEPGDEIEIEYEDDEVSMEPEADGEELFVEEPVPEVEPPVLEEPVDPITDTFEPDPLSFAGNPETAAEEMPPEGAEAGMAPSAVAMDAPEDEEEEIYIEDPTYPMV